MTTAPEFRASVVDPALQTIDLWSEAASDLLLGTAIQESGLRDVAQIGGGPARSEFQIEQATYDDIYANFLAYRPELKAKIDALCEPLAPTFEAITASAQYACAIARVKYLRSPEPLPAPGDIAGYAHMWKTVYNTPGGAGTEAEFIANWNAFGAGNIAES